MGGANDGMEWFGHDGLGNLTMRVATTSAGTYEYTPDPVDADRLCLAVTRRAYGSPLSAACATTGSGADAASLGATCWATREHRGIHRPSQISSEGAEHSHTVRAHDNLYDLRIE